MKEMVSVVIPTYNRASTICRAIDSVLNQDYKDIEVIVVDDGSTDETLSLLARYGDKIKICRQEHKGASRARNNGIQEAKGAYVAFQDSDDEWVKEKLSKQMKYMKKFGFKICYGAYRVTKGNRIVCCPDNYGSREHESGLLNVLRQHNVVGTPTLIACRDVFEDVGFFDEQMNSLEDYELVIRMAKKYKIGYVNEIMVIVHREKNSITINNNHYESYKRIIEKHADFLDMDYYANVMIDNGKIVGNKSVDYERLNEIKLICKGNKDWEIKCEKKAAKYCERYLDYFLKIRAQEYEHFLEKVVPGEFAIYGAGAYGTAVFIELEKKKLHPKCFTVTDGYAGDCKDVWGIPVVDIGLLDRKTPIIVALDLESQAEVFNNLNVLGFENYCGCLCGIHN